MKKPVFFQLYLDTRHQMDMLSDEQAGRLIKALYAFACDGELCELTDDPSVEMCFSFLSRQIERDFEKYRKKCAQNRKNVQTRYQKSTTVYDGYQEKQKRER